MTEKVLQTEKQEIFYKMTGTGKPVVFVHGFGEYGNIWDLLINDLKNQFQCIIPDLPGSGKSIMKKGAWTMEGFAESIKSILDHEGIQNAVIIGHSMGGYISLAFAEKYAENLAGMGLFHSSAFADSEEKKTIRKKAIQFIEEHGPVKFLEQSTPNLSPMTSKDFIPIL